MPSPPRLRLLARAPPLPPPPHHLRLPTRSLSQQPPVSLTLTPQPPRRRSLLLYFVQGTLLLHIFTEHFFALKRGDGPSMLPTAEVTGQWFLVSKHHSRGRGLHVGDLVIFDLPFHRDDMGMKRVLGLPGDYVLVDAPRTPITATTSDELMIQVPEGHCWLVGDNVPASRDSRLYGPVPLALVRGKIVARYWPWRDRRVFGPALAAAGPEA